MHKHQADLMLWLGDNVYFREADWNSWTGIIKRYTNSRSLPELQPLLASTHHYAIWDDHDYGPNDSDKGYFFKNRSLEAFKYFWVNPSYGHEENNGIFTFFNYGDADFILLDNRYHRDPNWKIGDDKTQLGQYQLEWLKNTLVSSLATFKFVAMGGQFLNTAAKYEMYTSYGFKKERDEIIEFIQAHKIKNIIFLSGDRHFTELSLLDEDGKVKIYDLTTSALTAGINKYGNKETNKHRVAGTLLMEHNFSKLSFRGGSKNRKLIIEVFNQDGEKKWEYTIIPEK